MTLTLNIPQMAAKVKPLPSGQSEGGIAWGSLSGVWCCKCWAGRAGVGRIE
jgi:hypothetical protein